MLCKRTLTIGGLQLGYRGSAPLAVESGVYWAAAGVPAVGQAIVALDGDGLHLHVVPGPGDQVRFVVQLAGAPLAGTSGTANREARWTALRAGQDRFLRDLAGPATGRRA